MNSAPSEITYRAYQGEADLPNAIAELDDSVARPAVLCGKQFWSDGKENTPHDVVRQAVPTVPAEERVRGACCCAREEEGPSKD